MDAGASVIAFVTLGLQSVKTVSNVVSAIKDGPAKLGDLQGAIASLQFLLEQMLQDPSLTNYPTAISSPILPVIQRCVDDIGRFEAEIGKLQFSPDEKKRGRLWKRLKLILKEKDIPYMITVVNSHVNALSLHCNVRLVGGLEETTRQQQGSQEFMAGLSRDFAAIASTASTTRTDIIASQAQIQGRLATIAPDIAGIASTQTGMANGMNEIRDLCQQMKAMLANNGLSNADIGGHRQTKDLNAWHEKLAARLDQLLRLLGEEARVISMPDAESIVELAETVFGIVRDDFIAVSFGDEEVATSRVKSLARGMQRLSAQFTTATSIRVNSDGSSDMAPFVGRTIALGNSKTFFVHNDRGDLTIDETRRIRQAEAGTDSNTGVAMIPWWEVNTTVSLLLPGEYSSGIVLKAAVREVISSQWPGQMILPPTISAYRIVPSDSDVFRYVREGNLRGLIQLLNDGKASLRDRDELGNSLLWIACKLRLPCPHLVSFLVEHGADLDEVGRSWKNSSITPLGNLRYMDRRAPFNDSLSCYRILLEHGADPMIGTRYPFPDTNPEFATAFLTLGQPFVDINFRDHIGYSFLHQATVMRVEFSIVKLLVDHGINVNAVTPNGQTALHLLLGQGIFCASADVFGRLQNPWVDMFESIKYLITHGADLSLIFQGESCWDIAYKSHWHGSYAGDIWDAALVATGHNVRKSRETCPHRASYTGVYTKKIFRQLWKGMEDLCPYYAEATECDDSGEEDAFVWTDDSSETESCSWETVSDSGQER